MKKSIKTLLSLTLVFGMLGCGSNAGTTNTSGNSGTNSQSNGDVIEFNDVVILDDETVKVELVNFYAKDVNWTTGKRNDKYFQVKVTNKADHKFLFNVNDIYIDGEKVGIIMEDGNSGPAAGKSSTFSYDIYYDTKPNPKELESLDKLYGVEGTIEICHYDKAGEKLTGCNEKDFSLKKALDGNSASSESEKQSGDSITENHEKYNSIIALLEGNTWVFNGGSDTILNYASFKDGKAELGQVSFDGNGLHEGDVNSCDYFVSDDSIQINLVSGDVMEVPYTAENASIKLGNGEYFTLDEVDAGLQGYWQYKKEVFGLKSIGNLYVNNGTLKSESASEAINGNKGDYYYYGPDSGTYKIGIGCFDTNLFKGSNWFYNIIDGKPVVLNYETVCYPSNGFPGENGYHF